MTNYSLCSVFVKDNLVVIDIEWCSIGAKRTGSPLLLYMVVNAVKQTMAVAALILSKS